MNILFCTIQICARKQELGHRLEAVLSVKQMYTHRRKGKWPYSAKFRPFGYFLKDPSYVSCDENFNESIELSVSFHNIIKLPQFQALLCCNLQTDFFIFAISKILVNWWTFGKFLRYWATFSSYRLVTLIR